MTDGPIEVRPSGVHGRGVYATVDLDAGEVACVAPAVLLDEADTDALHAHPLAAYLVTWDPARAAVPFGALSFTNHDHDPNAHLVVDHQAVTVALVVSRRVPAGTELTIDYGPGHPV